MNWETVSAIAEILGSVGVIVSLMYLAIQIKHAGKESHANSIHLINAQTAQVTTAISASPESADIYYRGNENLTVLSPAEQFRYHALMVQMFTAGSSQFYLHRLGLIPDEMYVIGRAVLKNVMQRPGAIQWWEQNASSFDAGFQRHVNEIAESD